MRAGGRRGQQGWFSARLILWFGLVLIFNIFLMLMCHDPAPGRAAAADAGDWPLTGLGGFALPPAGRGCGRSHATIDTRVSSGRNRPLWMGSGHEWHFLATGGMLLSLPVLIIRQKL